MLLVTPSKFGLSNVDFNLVILNTFQTGSDLQFDESDD